MSLSSKFFCRVRFKFSVHCYRSAAGLVQYWYGVIPSFQHLLRAGTVLSGRKRERRDEEVEATMMRGDRWQGADDGGEGCN